MSKVFVEYAINPEYRESFSHLYAGVAEAGRAFGGIGGNGSTRTFVEIWNEVSRDEYIILKDERLQQGGGTTGNQAAWEKWVKGGLSKLHMWHFTPVD